MARGRVDHLLVGRLLRAYDGWFSISYYKDTPLRTLLKYPPIENYVNEIKRPDDDRAWDFGRVRHFYEILRRGGEPDPIMVDNECSGMHILAEPVLVDGHHRLMGHMYAKRKTVPAYYSGRVDLLDWLTGKSRIKPAA